MEKQKLKERKINPKSHITLHTSHNSGITLVALIITIVVLLILAVVAIGAVRESGIIGHAKNAKSATTVAQEKEQIQLATNEWKIQKNYQNGSGVTFKSFMIERLSDVATIPNSDPDAGPLTVTMNNTGNQYIVYDNGTISEPWKNNGDGTLINGSETVEIGKTYSKEEFQQKLSEKGKTYTGSYAGGWQVIGAEGGKLKLVSTSNVNEKSVPLGTTDENVYKTDEAGNKILKDEIVDLNGDGDYDFEKAVWSYTHAVDTLDEVAQKATGISSARSVNVGDIESLAGIQDSEKGTEYLKAYKYNYTNHKDQVFVNDKGETIKIDSSEKEVTLKDTLYTKQLSANEIGKLYSGDYWLASPCVACGTNGATFRVRYINYGYISHELLFSSKGDDARCHQYGVRAVVSI